MEIKRYIVVQGVLLKDKTIIPIWDSRLTFSKDDMTGNQIYFVDGVNREVIYNIIECVYDLKTRSISRGIDIDIYPDLTDSRHKIGDIVLFENKSTHTLTKISDIIFEEFEFKIIKGKKMESWELRNVPKGTIIERDTLYALKFWKPTYILENGGKTIWEMYLRKIQNLDTYFGG